MKNRTDNTPQSRQGELTCDPRPDAPSTQHAGSSFYQPGEPLVSVVINNYNYGAFIRCAIDSALRQTYTSIEVIVVDDGSTDDSRAIIESYGERIKTVFKENGGQASAYNAGFAASRGELLLYLDADDVLDDAALEACVRLWRPGVVGVRFYLRVVLGLSETPTDVVLPTSRLAEGDLREDTLRHGHHMSPPSSGNLYARTALAQILPIPESVWRIGADTYCIFLTALLGPVRASPKAMGRYRVHGKNRDMGHFDNFRERLEKDVARDQMFKTFCEQRSIPYVPGSVTNQISHLKLRLASLLLDPEHHLYPEDRPVPLASRTIRVICRSRDVALSKKLMAAAWVLAILATPPKKRGKLVELALLPTRRFSLINRALSPAKVSGSQTLASPELGVKT